MKKITISIIALVVALGFSYGQSMRSVNPKGVDQVKWSNQQEMTVSTGDLYQSGVNLRAVGDSCSNPFEVTALPYNHTDSMMVNYNNVYGAGLLTPWGYSGGDVVYHYSVTVDEVITVDVSGDFDQAIAVFTDCSAPDSTSQVTAVDDNWQAPFAETLTLNAHAGDVYYFVVASYYDTLAAGSWMIDITSVPPCNDNLVADGTPEIEPNGGTNETPIQYDPRTIGTQAAPTKITGELSASGGSRDMDWFNFTLTSPMVVHFTGDVACGDIILFAGNVDMSDYIYVNDNGAEMGEVLATDVLAAGDYWVVIAPATYDDQDTFKYNAELWGVAAFIPPVGESFEGTFPPAGWSVLDDDGDSYNWEQSTNWAGQEGSYCATSASWDSGDGPLTPDNWLITPKLAIAAGDSISWYVAAQDPDWPAEKYAVMLSTASNDPVDFTVNLHEEILVDDVYDYNMVDLSAYAGQEVYIAFRHYDCTDNFHINIDNVTIPDSVPTVVDPTTVDVTFNVDISAVDSFDFANDTFFMAGSLAPVTSWEEPGTNMDLIMTDDDNDQIYTLTLTLDTGEIQFKFFRNSGWNGGEWTGDPNRVAQVVSDTTLNLVWGPDVNVYENILNDVSIYPNPTTGLVNIANAQNSTIQIIDIVGNVLISEISVENNKTLDLRELSNGIYTIRISNNDSFVTKQIILNR